MSNGEAPPVALEIRLAECEEQLRVISDAAHDAIIMRDGSGSITFWNKAAEKMFLYTAEEAYGLKFSILLDETPTQAPPENFYASMQENCATGSTLEMTAIRKDGAKFPVEVSIATARMGSKWSAISILRDITHHKEAEAILQHEKESAEDLTRLKSDFIRRVSHELRTPLTSIRGFARLVEKKLENEVFPAITRDNDKTKRSVDQVSENISIFVDEIERLSALVNDVLDISRLEEGRLHWDISSNNMGALVQEAMDNAMDSFRKKNVTPIAQIPKNLPDISCDRKEIMQVLNNLLSNAVKFTDEGAVTCKVQKTADGVRVSIIDTGMGIAEKEQETVFEKFTQLGDTLTDKPKGTGLGLAICRGIIHHHGGRIWLESTPGEGSSFHFELPIQPPEQIEP